MDIQQAIYDRRAVREFTTEPVDDATLRRLIEAAVQAPSAINEQPWLFTVVRDQTLLARISYESKASVLKAPPTTLVPQHLQELVSHPEFNIFYDAPALIVIASATRDQWAVENCSLAAENLMLAAANEGLGTCWIGFAQIWLETAEGIAALGLPATSMPVAPIIVGHPKSLPLPVPRKQPEIHWIG